MSHDSVLGITMTFEISEGILRNQKIITGLYSISNEHLIYTEQKKKRNDRPPRIFEFKGKTLIISGLLLYDSHSLDIRVYHAKN